MQVPGLKRENTDTHYRSEDGTGEFNWRFKVGCFVCFGLSSPLPPPSCGWRAEKDHGGGVLVCCVQVVSSVAFNARCSLATPSPLSAASSRVISRAGLTG